MRGREVQVFNNRIEGFSDDGVDFSGDSLVIKGNWITDHWDNDASLHPDCIQGQSSNWHLPYTGLRIENNICIGRTTNRPFQTKEYLQGISMFDGVWRDIKIRCNLILPRAHHGIAVYGMDDVRIEDNIVLSTDINYRTWILVSYSKLKKEPKNNVVRGNLSTGFPNVEQGKADNFFLRNVNLVRDNQANKVSMSGVILDGNTLAVWRGDKNHPVENTRMKVMPLDGPIPPMTVPEALKHFPLPVSCGRM